MLQKEGKGFILSAMRFSPRFLRFLLWSCVLVVAAYGLGRLYYRLTGGFTLSNITYNLPYDPRWDSLPLSEEEKAQLRQILDQKFTYLGKGCQSYVFKSEDDRYVIKFFKYQRFRPQAWLDYVTFIPGMSAYRQDKIEKKRNKLEGVFTSWKIAYEKLRSETGVLFIHLNKTGNLHQNVRLADKMGFEHILNLDDYEFMLQKKANLLCPTLENLASAGKMGEAQALIDRLLQLIVSEYRRGYADNDHALMQNTGVFDQQPIHIDVGQFVHNRKIQNNLVAHQELFNKTWKFQRWLNKEIPQLGIHLKARLQEIIGPDYAQLKPRLRKGGVAALSHISD